MLLVVPALAFAGVALVLMAVAWHVASRRLAMALLGLAASLGALALWIFGSTAWAFRDGYRIAAPGASFVESQGEEAFARFWSEARYGAMGAVGGIALLAACLRHRQAGGAHPPKG